MLGPLPLLHRALVLTTVLVVGVLSGAWVAYFTVLPVAASMGALAGGLAGVLLATVLLHDDRRRPARARHRR